MSLAMLQDTDQSKSSHRDSSMFIYVFLSDHYNPNQKSQEKKGQYAEKNQKVETLSWPPCVRSSEKSDGVTIQ